MSDHLVHYGILTADEHDLVVARLNGAPKRGVGRPPKTYLLSGIAQCGVCGSAMGASSGRYLCQAVRCGKVGIKAALADDVVIKALQRLQPDAGEVVPTAGANSAN